MTAHEQTDNQEEEDEGRKYQQQAKHQAEDANDHHAARAKHIADIIERVAVTSRAVLGVLRGIVIIGIVIVRRRNSR